MNDSIRKEAYDIFVTNANHSSRSKIMWVKKHHPDLYIQIENNYKDNISFIEKIWLYINNMNEIPKCPICGKNTKFDGKLSRGYRTYCSIQCVNKSKSVFEKRKKSMIKNFGVEHTFQSKSLMEKSANTVQNKYHVKNVSNSEEIINRKKKNNIIKFGVENVFLLPEIQQKLLETKKIKFANKISKTIGISPNNITFEDKNIIIKNYCNIHQEFIISKFNYYNRIRYCVNLCTKCFPIKESSSIKEIEVRKFIENDLGIKTEKIKIDQLEADIFLSPNKICFEFNGLYWHSEALKHKNYHINKTKQFEKHGIETIHIFEDEWALRNDIVKSIIKTKLNIFDNIIDSNNLIIKNINNELANNFLHKNYIHDITKNNINIGLFYDNELISVLAVKYIKNKEKYEILAFCDILNTQIINSTENLFNFFIRNYNPKLIIAFVDKRYFNGKDYKSLGFKLKQQTKPNHYFYIKGTLIRKKQINKKKYESKRIRKGKPVIRKYLKIYDCGSLVYIFKQ